MSPGCAQIPGLMRIRFEQGTIVARRVLRVGAERVGYPKGTQVSMKDFSPAFPKEEGCGGIYVHVPFCRTRCNYCTFVTSPYNPAAVERYIAAVKKEITLWSSGSVSAELPSNFEVDTLYFGGGTPSLLDPPHVQELLEACQKAFVFIAHPEITLEINPATSDASTLRTLRRAGINRASLGIQSFDDAELAAMGRAHTVRDALTTFDDLRSAGFDNISVDLIAGFPGQTRASVGQSLRAAIGLGPEHVSVYLLEVKEGSRLESMIRTGIITGTDEDLAADLYLDICSTLTCADYVHYEISNFARKGRRSKHNLKYWSDRLYLGIGPGAHGMTGHARYANLAGLGEYERDVNQGRLPVGTWTGLTPETRFAEALIMGLRLVEGLDLAGLEERYCVDANAFVLETIGDLQDAGLFVLADNRLVLTERGRLLSNLVFSRWV